QLAYMHGTLFGDLGNRHNSPYFEELMRNFCYVAYGVSDSEKNSLKADAQNAVENAGSLWNGLLIARSKVPDKVQTMDPAKIADEKKRKMWAGTSDGSPESMVYPWSLPDPWSNASPNHAQNTFESA